eukprot:1149218-Pelagomonas_calceolata.AAC.1
MSNDPSPQQKQYHTHHGPMIIEKWALPFFKKAGFNQQASALLPALTLNARVAKSATTIMAMSMSNSSHNTPTCMFATCANVPTTGNAWENLDAIMMSKGKRSTQLKPGPVLPVLASATKTKLTEHISLKKNCLRLFGYHHGSQKD